MLILIGSDFGVLWHLGSQNDVILLYLRLAANSNCFPHPYYTYPKCLGTLICTLLAYSNSLTRYTHTTLLRFWGSGSLVESKWCHYVLVEADSDFKLLPTSILDKCKVFEHSDMLFIDIQQLPYTVILTLLGSDFGVASGSLVELKFVITSYLRLIVTSNSFPHPY